MQLKIKQHLIAQGVFGKVFDGELAEKNDESSRVVAVKICHVSNKVRHTLLLHEACAWSILKGHRNIPEVFAWGRSQFFEYMALQRLGPTLHEAFQGDKPEPLSLRNMVILVCQMIDAVQHVHSKGIVHRDIKPDNFILGPPGTELAGRLYLIDFGLCKPYRDPETGEHLPCKRTWRRVACRTFSTVYDNFHETLSRRDDMIALAYTMMALLIGILPWEWIHEDDLPDDRDEHYTEDAPFETKEGELPKDAPPVEHGSEEEASHEPASHHDEVINKDTAPVDASKDDTTTEPVGDGSTAEHSSSVTGLWVPWSERWTTADFVNCKLAWSDGKRIAEGYPDVFEEFYTYTLLLQYEATPDYDRWKERFREAMPCLPEDPMYDPADTAEPLVGVSLITAEDMKLPLDQEVGWRGISNGDSPIPGGDDGWMPAGEFWWDEPYAVKVDEVLGDELKIIEESGVRVFGETPESEIPLLDPGCPPECMLSLEMSRKAAEGEL